MRFRVRIQKAVAESDCEVIGWVWQDHREFPNLPGNTRFQSMSSAPR